MFGISHIVYITINRCFNAWRESLKMAFTWDTTYVVNLILCIVILILGYWGHRKRKDTVPIYIGVAFGLFGISHLATLFGLTGDWTNTLIIIRVLAYLTVIFALYKYATSKSH